MDLLFLFSILLFGYRQWRTTRWVSTEYGARPKPLSNQKTERSVFVLKKQIGQTQIAFTGYLMVALERCRRRYLVKLYRTQKEVAISNYADLENIERGISQDWDNELSGIFQRVQRPTESETVQVDSIRLYDEMEQLAKLERKVVCMHILKDYSFAQIAKIIGRPESSVKTIYYRTLKKLKHRLF